MTESDVVCFIYSELRRGLRRPRKAVSKAASGEEVLDESKHQVLTLPLHSELSFRMWGRSGYVDICIFDPSDVEFWVPVTKYDREDGWVPVTNWNWEPCDSIGIEVKFNRWITKKRQVYGDTNRERKTGDWRRFEKSLIEDLRKLRSYQRGWLIFVDQRNLFGSRRDWKEFAQKLIKLSGYGSAKRTLNAYYLSPRFKTALPFR
ncbi:MAG: hypothetical protein KAR39_02945 [Thermoplasmata archaeon]|nr:hypothetical protein [Thermoplasmata archaeon]